MNKPTASQQKVLTSMNDYLLEIPNNAIHSYIFIADGNDRP